MNSNFAIYILSEENHMEYTFSINILVHVLVSRFITDFNSETFARLFMD